MHLRCPLLSGSMRPSPIDDRFLEQELQGAQSSRGNAIIPKGRYNFDTISWPIAGVRAVNCENKELIYDRTALRLCVHGPRGMQLMLVDDDGVARRKHGILLLEEETPRNMSDRLMYMIAMPTHFLPFVHREAVNSYLIPATQKLFIKRRRMITTVHCTHLLSRAQL